jgi:uncharacterized membrane protein YccC
MTADAVRSLAIRVRNADPGHASLKSAARAAIVIPAVFAIADKVIANPQTSTLAAFGSFAMLVLVEFGGPWRARLAAYVTLAVAGAGLVVLGTLCSRNAWLSAGAMLVVGFAILFSGAINGYFAVAGTAAMLVFILPVTIPAPNSAIPDRLAGWGLAAGAGILAAMLLWPPGGVGGIRTVAARATLALAELADARLRRDATGVAQRAEAAEEAVVQLRRRFLASPHRPTAPAGPTAGLAALVDELDWLSSFLFVAGEPRRLDPCPQENAELLAAVVAVLRASAARLDGRDDVPDLDRLEAAQKTVARVLAQRLDALPPVPDDVELASALEPSFRLRALSYATRAVARYALLVSGVEAPGLDRSPSTVLGTTRQLAAEHRSVRSVWLRNSIRGAVAVAVAVFIAQRSGVQHSFWVVLGTLSVLRSSALGTGATILRALAGSAIGILIGSGLVIAIGTRMPVLWAVLPVAVLLAAFAPRAISFAAGQAGFTVVLFILFNIIQPVGWRIGLVRIEDVAIGFAVSLGVGLLFWPRGATGVLRHNLAEAYASSADYVVTAAHQLVGTGYAGGAERAAAVAFEANHRLDDSFRQYLGERSTTGNVESLGALVAGASRLQRAAQSLFALSQMADGSRSLACAAALDGELEAFRSWYFAFGRALANSKEVPAPHVQDAEGRRRVLLCVSEAVADGDKTMLRPALSLLWATQHLDHLWRLEGHLSRSAAEA